MAGPSAAPRVSPMEESKPAIFFKMSDMYQLVFDYDTNEAAQDEIMARLEFKITGARELHESGIGTINPRVKISVGKDMAMMNCTPEWVAGTSIVFDGVAQSMCTHAIVMMTHENINSGGSQNFGVASIDVVGAMHSPGIALQSWWENYFG
jgi:hypothetical protein